MKEPQHQSHIFINNQKISPPKLVLMEHQVGGKTPKFISKDNRIVYKNLSFNEHQFYKNVNKLTLADQGYLLKRFLPQYEGTADNIEIQQLHRENNTSKQKWLEFISRRATINLTKYIKLQNFNYGFKHPNIMDIKLGTKQFKALSKNLIYSTTKSKKFRINGISILLFQQHLPKQYFLNKYYGRTIQQHQLQQHFAFFFFNGKKVNLQLLKKYIQDIRQLIFALKSYKGVRFQSSSLLFSYDAYQPLHHSLKFIDFDKCYSNPYQPDYNIIEGVENVHHYLLQTLNNIEQQQKTLLQKSTRIYSNIQYKKQKIN